MREDDLAPFAVADGLLERMAADPGILSDTEVDHLVERARGVLAVVTGETLEMAAAAMETALEGGEFTIQAGNKFAAVTMYGTAGSWSSSPGSSWPASATPSTIEAPGIGYHSHYLYCLGGKCSRWRP